MSEMLESRQTLKSLVENYTHSFPTFEQSRASRSDEGSESQLGAVVLLSGSTGAFGANILAALAGSPNVRLAYAISRPSTGGTGVYERHARAFRREGIDTALLKDAKVRLIEGDLTLQGFGMIEETFRELKSSVTHIIHNGWQVKFNLPVLEFEPNIRSVRNLVDFALTSKACSDRPVKVIFISSIGVLRNTDPADPEKIWPEERLVEPDSALGLGYAESKWVSENVLDGAARRTALRPTVVRLGQLVGGPSGYWSEREWFAALVKSSMFFGMLPSVPGMVAWNRSHVAARALVDMLNTEERYVHLVHPRPVAWMALISIFSRKLGLPIVHIDEWMETLQRAHAHAESTSSSLGSASGSRESMRQAFRQNPAARMLDFFCHQHDSCRGKPLAPDQQSDWTPLLRCEKAVAASQTLQNPELPQIGEADVEGWVSNWEKFGLFNTDGRPGVNVERKSAL